MRAFFVGAAFVLVASTGRAEPDVEQILQAGRWEPVVSAELIEALIRINWNCAILHDPTCIALVQSVASQFSLRTGIPCDPDREAIGRITYEATRYARFWRPMYQGEPEPTVLPALNYGARIECRGF